MRSPGSGRGVGGGSRGRGSDVSAEVDRFDRERRRGNNRDDGVDRGQLAHDDGDRPVDGTSHVGDDLAQARVAHGRVRHGERFDGVEDRLDDRADDAESATSDTPLRRAVDDGVDCVEAPPVTSSAVSKTEPAVSEISATGAATGSGSVSETVSVTDAAVSATWPTTGSTTSATVSVASSTVEAMPPAVPTRCRHRRRRTTPTGSREEGEDECRAGAPRRSSRSVCDTLAPPWHPYRCTPKESSAILRGPRYACVLGFERGRVKSQ